MRKMGPSQDLLHGVALRIGQGSYMLSGASKSALMKACCHYCYDLGTFRPCGLSNMPQNSLFFCLLLEPFFPTLLIQYPHTGKGGPISHRAGMAIFVPGALKKCCWPQRLQAWNRHCRPPRGTVGGSPSVQHPALPLPSWQGQAQKLACLSTEAGQALLPGCWLHFCLKYNPCFSRAARDCARAYVCGTLSCAESLLLLQRAEMALQGPHLMGENCRGQWVSFPGRRPPLGIS